MYKLLELRPWMIDENSGVYEMLQEIPAIDEFEQHNQYNGMTKKEVKETIVKMMCHAYGFNNNENYPKCENYILFVNDIPVCIGGLMLEMTDFWRKHRGHIWYKTRPTAQKQGYCTKFTELLCLRAKEFNLEEITAQCDINNYGSNKVLLNNKFETYINPLCPNWNDTKFYRKKL